MNIKHFMLGLICVGISAVGMAQSGFYIAPHIQNIQQDSATFIWESNEAEKAMVQFGSEGGALDQSLVGEDEVTKIHRIKAKGLKPSTRYTYRISSGDDVQEATFITAPVQKDEMTFIVMGDSRRWGNGIWERSGMDQHVLQWDAEVFLTMGDLVRDGHQYEQWPEHFERFSALTDKIWFVTARGNHEGSQLKDIENDWFAKYHELPGDGEPYAYFDWGNTHFVLVSYESTGHERDWTKSSEWLDKHLAGVDKQYTVVAQHFPVYCTGYYGADRSRKEPGKFAANFRNVMEKHDVTLNTAGHTHIYERHYPLKENERNDRDGVWYVVNGGDIGGNFPDWWTYVVDDRTEHSKPTYTVYQMNDDRVIGRSFAYVPSDQSIVEIDYFVIWEDEAVPTGRLAQLTTAQGDELLSVIKDLAGMLYAPSAKALLPFLEHDDEAVRQAAAKSIGLLGNIDVAEDLLPYVSSVDPVMAKYAARSIEAAMPNSVEKQVVRLLKDASVSEDARFHLVGALQLRSENTEKMASVFLDVLESGEATGELRNRLAYAVGETATKKHTKRLVRLFDRSHHQYVTLGLGYALNNVTGNRNSLKSRGPVASSKPGKRDQFIDRWLDK